MLLDFIVSMKFKKYFFLSLNQKESISVIEPLFWMYLDGFLYALISMTGG